MKSFKLIASAAALALLSPMPLSAQVSARAGVGARVSSPPAPATTSAMTYTVRGTYSDGTSRYYDLVADTDSDGDGVPEEGTMRITCTGTTESSVSYKLSPRDSASGLATGKRTHHPMRTIDKASPLLGKKVSASWDLKSSTKARSSSGASPDDLWVSGTAQTSDLHACHG